MTVILAYSTTLMKANSVRSPPIARLAKKYISLIFPFVY